MIDFIYKSDKYTVDKKMPVIENWFMAANKNSKFIKSENDVVLGIL